MTPLTAIQMLAWSSPPLAELGVALRENKLQVPQEYFLSKRDKQKMDLVSAYQRERLSTRTVEIIVGVASGGKHSRHCFSPEKKTWSQPVICPKQYAWQLAKCCASVCLHERSRVTMEAATYTRNTRTPAGGYQIIIKHAGILLWAVTINCSEGLGSC